jgi:transcription antitermination factor NusB
MDNDFIIPLDLCHAGQMSKTAQRALVLHVLYTYEQHEHQKTLGAIFYDYAKAFQCIIEDDDLVFKHAKGTIDFISQADLIIIENLKNWSIDRLSILTRSILRYALWELIIEKTDLALVVNESVELAKGFAEEDSYRLINGILDNVSKRLDQKNKVL